MANAPTRKCNGLAIRTAAKFTREALL